MATERARVSLTRWRGTRNQPPSVEVFDVEISAARLRAVRRAIVRWHDGLEHEGGRKVGTWATSCVPQAEGAAFLERRADEYADVLAARRRGGLTSILLMYALTLHRGVKIDGDVHAKKEDWR